MKLLILENRHTKKKRQLQVKSDCFKVGDEFVIDNKDWKVVKVVEKKAKKGKKRDRPLHLILENMYNKVKIHYVTPRDYKVGDEILYNYAQWKVIKVIKPQKEKKSKVIFSEFSGMPLNWEIPKYMKDMIKGLQKPNMIHSYYRKAGKNTAYEIIKKEEARRKLSEFHKRPYLKVTVEEVKGKSQGKENLGKIQFPCYCSYINGSLEYIGQLNHGFDIHQGKYIYELHQMDRQGFCINREDTKDTLKELMDEYRIHILKAEVKLFKEVGEYTKKKEK